MVDLIQAVPTIKISFLRDEFGEKLPDETTAVALEQQAFGKWIELEHKPSFPTDEVGVGGAL
jgi:hypothetical protein